MGNHPRERVEQGRIAVAGIRSDLRELCVLGRRSQRGRWGEVCGARAS